MLNQSLFTGSKYEDIEAIARISSGDLILESEFHTYFTEVIQNFNMVSGRILSQADYQKLATERRPNFEWNLFMPIVVAVASNFKNSIPGLDFFNTTKEDYQSSNLLADLNHWTFYNCNDIEYEIAKAFLFALIGRISWLFQDYTFADPRFPEGKILITHYDGLKIKFDPNWTKRDTSDMMFMDNDTFLSPEEIIQIYAKNKRDMEDEIRYKSATIIGESTANKANMRQMISTWAERVMGLVTGYTGEKTGYDVVNTERFNPAGEWYNRRGRFKVIDWYEKRLTWEMKLYDPLTGNGNGLDITNDVKRKDINGYYNGRDWYDNQMLQQIRSSYPLAKIQVTQPLKIWQTSIVPALQMKVYDALQNIQNGYFKFTPVLCFDFHPDILHTRSMVDHIKGPIKSANLRRNTMLTYLMRIAHGGWIGEQTYVQEFIDYFKSNEIGGIKLVKDGALSQKRVQQLQTPAFPSALDKFVVEEVEATKYLSGSGDSSRGMVESKGESGVLYNARIQQQEIAHQWIHDNAGSALLPIGYNNLALIQKYMKYERTLMILKDNTDPMWLTINQRSINEILNDPTVGSYIIRISKQPYGRLAKDREFQQLVMIYEMMLKTKPEYIDYKLLVEMSGISVASKIIQHIEKIDTIVNQQLKATEDNLNLQNELTIQSELQKLTASQLNNKKLMEDMVFEDVAMGMLQ